MNDNKNASALDYAKWALEEILTMHADNQSSFNNGDELDYAKKVIGTMRHRAKQGLSFIEEKIKEYDNKSILIVSEEDGSKWVSLEDYNTLKQLLNGNNVI